MFCKIILRGGTEDYAGEPDLMLHTPAVNSSLPMLTPTFEDNERLNKQRLTFTAQSSDGGNRHGVSII